ncbi:uncharacterized protein Tco025E_05110 [Trypanosoma conorhini]|uniref:Uncharacterized protein n=1 Tax=Trypanosoma conorhini TaxID=83891 RepID=A0A422PG01_9TRYP|nr:uncharacterized protein Tco025E_05110 [Trypanosoma conorhini]RNF16631.1 hypothetical protein Tco025E_05110 [Trypanosoma conorhini]
MRGGFPVIRPAVVPACLAGRCSFPDGDPDALDSFDAAAGGAYFPRVCARILPNTAPMRSPICLLPAAPPAGSAKNDGAICCLANLRIVRGPRVVAVHRAAGRPPIGSHRFRQRLARGRWKRQPPPLEHRSAAARAKTRLPNAEPPKLRPQMLQAVRPPRRGGSGVINATAAVSSELLCLAGAGEGADPRLEKCGSGAAMGRRRQTKMPKMNLNKSARTLSQQTRLKENTQCILLLLQPLLRRVRFSRQRNRRHSTERRAEQDPDSIPRHRAQPKKLPRKKP